MDIHTWIENQWRQARLGDARRNARAIKLAEDLINKPSASFPEQCSNWGSLKAAYRFFNEKDVSFEALQQPHRSQVIEQARRPGISLFIQDGSEIDYTSHDVVEVEIQPPKYMGQNKKGIPGTYIRVWETREEGLKWILFSSLPIENFEQAYEKVKWYSMRWMIEEYHKCLKTSCGVENRNFQTGRALEAVIGMFGIIAAKLLELKYISG